MKSTVVERAREAFETWAAHANSAASVMQAQLAAWQTRNFGTPSLEQIALGVAEEAGELCHATLKKSQGIRGMHGEEFRAKAADAVGDVCIYLMQYCTALRLDWATVVRETAAEVMRRDWKAAPTDGVVETSAACIPGIQPPR